MLSGGTGEGLTESLACANLELWSSGGNRSRNIGPGGAGPLNRSLWVLPHPFERAAALCQLFCSTRTAVIFLQLRPGDRRSRGGSHTAGCGYRGRPQGPGGSAIGEVWTSPRRESPRIPGCSWGNVKP